MKRIYSGIFCSIILLAACSPSNKNTDVKAPVSANAETAVKVTDDSSEILTKHGIADHPGNVLGGLEVGDLAPDFELQDEKGNLVSLSKKLESGPVLVIFYRADWCSICVRALGAFEDKIVEMEAGGKVSVMAISPQLPKYSKKLSNENNYSFPILYDKEHQAMKDYKVFFHVTEKYNQKITEVKGDPIELRNGNTEPVMPVPATYLIGKDGKIKFVHYDPNYRVRADIDEVMKLIKA